MEVAAEAPDAEAFDICAVIPVIEAVGGCVVHSGGDPRHPPGTTFDHIELSEPKKCYSSIVCAGQASDPLCLAAVAVMGPHMARAVASTSSSPAAKI